MEWVYDDPMQLWNDIPHEIKISVEVELTHDSGSFRTFVGMMFDFSVFIFLCLIWINEYEKQM